MPLLKELAALFLSISLLSAYFLQKTLHLKIVLVFELLKLELRRCR